MKRFFVACIMATCLTGCIDPYGAAVQANNSQIATRNYQSRMFETADKAAVMRSVIATMQDLDFIIERADEKLGTVSGTSFTNSSKMTVSVRTTADKQTIVRANAQSRLHEITNPVAYQNFFNALSQSMFLDAHEVE